MNYLSPYEKEKIDNIVDFLATHSNFIDSLQDNLESAKDFQKYFCEQNFFNKFNIDFTFGRHKIVLVIKDIDYVLKFSLNKNFNSIENEIQIYQEAKEKQLEKYFEEIIPYKNITNNLVIYIQKKVYYPENGLSYWDKAKWLYNEKFCKFLDKCNLLDISNHNLGLNKNNELVLIDYVSASEEDDPIM